MQSEDRRRRYVSDNPKVNFLTDYLDIDGEVKVLLRLCDKVETYQERARNAFDRATKATSRMTATRNSGTSAHDAMANAVCDMIEYQQYAEEHKENGELQRRLCRKIKEHADTMKRVLDAIDTVKDTRLHTLLVYRYLMGWSWDFIADRMMYDRTWIWKLHGDALNAMQVDANVLENYKKTFGK